MEKTNIPYSEWPDWIKVLTARYVKRVIPKEPKVVRNLSYFNLLIGISVLVIGLNSDSALSFTSFPLVFLGILNIIAGGLNFFYGYKMYVWVTQNSSWEERFAAKSSGKHQLLYLLMYLVLTLISLGIACLLCC